MNVFEWLLYCAAVVIMIATPGPVMLLVASAGLKGGYKKALQTIFGTNSASLVLILLSVSVLKGALQINDQWLSLIKIFGCIYIAYIGLQVLKEAREAQPEQNQAALPDTQGGFKQGFLVGISNPKDIIFFASFFPQFTGITADLNLSLSILTVSWIILDFATLSLVYLAFNRLSGSAVYPKLLGICGAVLVLVALYGIYSAVF